MNKDDKFLTENLQTPPDGLTANSINTNASPSLLNSPRVQKCDVSTITDHLICNCACDLIPKLKEKAHKSFMQVIQIENLYKEEIQQLKNFYEQSLKTNDKKWKIKEDMLKQKCQELQCQIEQLKDQWQKMRMTEIETEEPFKLENIENIGVQASADESSQFIYNIRQFIQTPNLKQNAQELEQDINNSMADLKKANQNICGAQSENKTWQIQRNMDQQLTKIFTFIANMIQNTILATEKYNNLVHMANEAENRYTKVFGLYEAGQKQAKFMSEHIKKISQDRIQAERKNNELERTIKNHEQNIKFLKKLAAEREVKVHSESPKKEIDCMTTYNPRQHQVDRVITNSLLSSKIERTNHHGILAKSMGNGDKILPRSLNFKKKSSHSDRQNK